MNLFNLVQMSLKTTLNPPGNATASQIRIYGLGAWFVGFFIMVILCWAIAVLEKEINHFNLGIIYACIAIIAFGLMTTGCYRVLSGKKTSENLNASSISFARIVVGGVSFLLSLMIPISIMLLFLYFLQWIGIEPNTLF
jgi:hypothetical protein